MTPEKTVEKVRAFINERAEEIWDGSELLEHERDMNLMLYVIDTLRAENYLLRQGRGGTPETHTHPIENSREN